MTPARHLLLSLALSLPGCTIQDIVALRGGDIDRGAHCAGSGPPPLPDLGTGAPACGGRVAAALFSRALCLCAEGGGRAALRTDSFDSRRGPYAPGGIEGGVSINGKLEPTGPQDLSIGGPLTVAGAEGIQAGAAFTARVAGALRVAGPIRAPAAGLTALADAEVAGDVLLRDLRVGGILTVPESARVEASGQRDVPTLRRGPVPVQVDPPCPCMDPGAAPTWVDDLVEAHRQRNDNAAIGLPPDRLALVREATVLELPCGRFFLSRIEGEAPLELRVSGRAALFVEGQITLGRDFRITLDGPAAELDLFLRGNLNLSGDVSLGAPEAPSRLRLYVGSTGSLRYSGRGQIAAGLYAPRTDLAQSGALVVHGSLLLQRLTQVDTLTVHHDLAARALDAACAP